MQVWVEYWLTRASLHQGHVHWQAMGSPPPGLDVAPTCAGHW